MAPIRIGFIGLSKPLGAMKTPVNGAWGQTAHLPAILAQPHLYQITALCNSSIETAKASIAGHNLPAGTKAYDDPEALANDPEVDLVVVSVFIGKHYMLAKPALEAGKMVYVEAPLAASVAEAEELASLAKAKGVRTMVATQARGSAVVHKARELILAGEIGEIVSSSVVARMGGYASSNVFPVGAKFALDLESPGNSLLIGFNHFFDSHQQVLGHHSTYSANLEIKSGPKALVNPATLEVVEHMQPTTPDHIFLQGKLASGALFSIAWRPNISRGAKSTPSLTPSDTSDHSYFRWFITGTKAELEITTPDSMWQMAGTSAKVWLTKDGERKEVPVEREFGDSVSFVAENTAAQYKAFAKGDKEKYADFQDAAASARFMEELRDIARAQLTV